MKTSNKQSGFTLVELAIVLVIIGLIVGGVLVGQDLIKAATLQKGIKSLSDTEAAATTFRNKYNGLPGDLNGTTATATFTAANGFPVAIAGGNNAVSGLGDGDGNIIAVTTAAGGTATASLGASGEVAAFYPELYAAGYIKDQMTGDGATANTLTMTSVAAAQANIKTGMFLHFATSGANQPLVVASSFSGKNYLTIVGSPTGAAASGIPPWTVALTPGDAANIDAKLDDGVPNTGGVISLVAATPVPGTFGGGAANTTGCYNTTGNIYNTAVATQQCVISYRASF